MLRLSPRGRSVGDVTVKLFGSLCVAVSLFLPASQKQNEMQLPAAPQSNDEALTHADCQTLFLPLHRRLRSLQKHLVFSNKSGSLYGDAC